MNISLVQTNVETKKHIHTIQSQESQHIIKSQSIIIIIAV